jgi:hypothetical protein
MFYAIKIFIIFLLYYYLNNIDLDIFHFIRYGALFYVLENNAQYLI